LKIVDLCDSDFCNRYYKCRIKDDFLLVDNEKYLQYSALLNLIAKIFGMKLN